MSLRTRIHSVADEALGNTAYLVDVGDGKALIVDPRRDVDAYLSLARSLSLQIVGVLETHLHADFVSGARELIATGAQLFAATDAGLTYEHHGVSPDDRLTFENVSVEVLATPGHTPEHLSFLLTSPDGDAVFTGGSLINGGAARTDLTGSERTEELARAQFASLRGIASLPAATLLCPTHGAGSFCSAAEGVSEPRTIGEELRANPLLAIPDENAFVRAFIESFGSYPSYFHHLRALNKAGAPLLDDVDHPPHLDGEEARARIEDGAWLIDARPVDEWARAHPDGAVSIELRPAFASWLGWVVPFGEPVVFVIDDAQLAEALQLARRIGYDRIQGWTTIEDWRAAGAPIASAESADPRDVDDAAVLLDVRQDAEYAGSRLPNAVPLELGDIIRGKVPEADSVIVYCGHGERSATAVSLLARRGVRAKNLAGGISAWRAAGLPVAR